MPTYLYCVLAPPSADSALAGLTGIAGAPVRALTAAELAPMEAWVATIAEETLRVSGTVLAAQALVHNEVVNAALATGRTPAPARYGSRFADDSACIADVTRRADELRAILDHVAGAVEMPVLLAPHEARRAALEKPKAGDPAAGRRYLESIRTRVVDEDRRRSAADRDATRLRASIGDLARDETRNFTSAGVMSIAHLVPVAAIERYRQLVAMFVPNESFRVVMGEPRAPYSFASAPTTRGGRHDSSSPDRGE